MTLQGLTMKTKATVLALACLLGSGCIHLDPYVWVDDLPENAYQPDAYRIQPGDSLHVSIWNQDELTGDVRVRADGQITLPLVGDVPVAGLTPTDASDMITKRLDGLVLNPAVAVAVREGRLPQVSVLGEVRTAGQFTFSRDETVLHLIAKAGGLTEFAQPDAIFVVRKGHEQKRVRFSYDELSRGKGRGLEFKLRDGDVIVVE